MAIPLNEAKQILEPYIPHITNCVNSAIHDYINKHSNFIYTKRTRASIINDLMIDYANKLLLNLPGIHWKYKRNSFYFIIQDKFKLRFKMFGKNLRTSNIPTQQSLNFLNQQESLFSAPVSVTNIFAGYRWNYLQTEHDGIFITCPDGSYNQWVLELTPKAIPTTVNVVPIYTPTPPTTPTDRRRVRARKVDNNVKNAEK